jgi:hypothetical protein
MAAATTAVTGTTSSKIGMTSMSDIEGDYSLTDWKETGRNKMDL